ERRARVSTLVVDSGDAGHRRRLLDCRADRLRADAGAQSVAVVDCAGRRCCAAHVGVDGKHCRPATAEPADRSDVEPDLFLARRRVGILAESTSGETITGKTEETEFFHT